MLEEMIGARSEPVRNWVERGAVRRFADAIGDPNPLYRDEDAARASRWGRLIAPPTFPRVFDYGEIPGLELPAAGLIHGEQRYRYARPLFVGEEIVCHGEVKHVYEKQGRAGKLTFMVFERIGVDARGERVFAAEEVAILTETVMGRMAP